MIKVTVQQVLRKHWSHGFILGRLETSLFLFTELPRKKIKYYNQCSQRSYKNPEFVLIVLFSQHITGRYKLTVYIETFFIMMAY